jgi:hypothetical protein
MSDFERKVREALAAEEAELQTGPAVPARAEQLIAQFRARRRWLTALVFGLGAIWALVAVVTTIEFFRAESLRAMIAWAGGYGLCLMNIALVKTWYWMELNKNAVTREVKRVELLVTHLANQLKAAG